MLKSELGKSVLKIFEDITKIPRCSKNEEHIQKWLLAWARENSFETKTDSIGNVLIIVPGSKGYENAPTLVLQGHMDMVCEKTPESSHDFSKDPLKLYYDDEWLNAKNTTLGADNGIALAVALALSADKTVEHPPFELLFTVDEETGLTGAINLDETLLSGKILLNIDSEDEGVLTIGCAGGLSSNITLSVDRQKIPADFSSYKLKLGGFKGGHSGVDIKKGRGNAIKELARVLLLLGEVVDYKLQDIVGGSAHNAIPRDAEAKIALNEHGFEKIKSIISHLEYDLKNEYMKNDQDLFISVERSEECSSEMISGECSGQVLNIINALPHGVFSMSQMIDGLVETSNNIATVKIKDDTFEVLTSQRSSLKSRLDLLTSRIESIAKLSGAKIKHGDGYPAWQPNWESDLLKRCKEAYKNKFSKEPVVEVIHAGLECGIIGDKYPGMEMISFGPTIQNPHSPDERMKVTDIDKILDFMIELFRAYKL